MWLCWPFSSPKVRAVPPKTKVLISAYACEPDQGSEAGIGWNWVTQASRFCETWIITRLSNRAVIEEYLRNHPLPQAHFVYYDLPRWARWWKNGPRGIRAYYYLWQIGVFRLAKRLHDRIGFDLSHHVTFGSYWMPTLMGQLPIPFVWGPVGGGESAPKSFYRTFSISGRLKEHLRDLVRSVGEADPLVRLAARKARVALATTEDTAVRIRRLTATPVEVLSHVALPPKELELLEAFPLRTHLPFRVISIGRLVDWKGFHLGLDAFAAFHQQYPESEYCIVGEGPERERLMRLARRQNIHAAVKFLGHVTRARALEALAESDVLLHPSLHDSGGYVCAEAIAAGRPVVCFGIGGPAIIVSSETGFVISPERPDQAIHDLTEALAKLACSFELRALLAAAGRARARWSLNWNHIGDQLPRLYRLGIETGASEHDDLLPSVAVTVISKSGARKDEQRWD